MRLIFLNKARRSPDKVVFWCCMLIAVLWLAFEYGLYIGRAESCTPKSPASSWRA